MGKEEKRRANKSMALGLGFGFVTSTSTGVGVPPLVWERRDGFGGWCLWGRRRRERFGGVVRLVASGEKGDSLRTGEELRTQLDLLQAEAEDTRSKANGARLRLLRLSEAAEQLQKQAALNVQSGRENDARELLFQKKKIMNALEKSKNRIELFDKLSRKLSEAISLKETELIGNVASQPPISLEDTDTPVRIVSPKTAFDDESQESEGFEQMDGKIEDTQEVEPEKGQVSDSEYNMQVQPVSKGKPSINTVNESNISFLMSITSYKAFLEHVDQQLTGIEDDLLAVLKLSNLIMGSEQREKNTNMKQTSEILQDITSIRERIAGIVQSVIDVS